MKNKKICYYCKKSMGSSKYYVPLFNADTNRTIKKQIHRKCVLREDQELENSLKQRR